jgi:hypothetical protein
MYIVMLCQGKSMGIARIARNCQNLVVAAIPLLRSWESVELQRLQQYRQRELWAEPIPSFRATSAPSRIKPNAMRAGAPQYRALNGQNIISHGFRVDGL